MNEIDLKKNILTSGSFRVLIMIASFFTSFMSARYLGVEIKGEYSYLLTTTGCAWAILDMGISKSIPFLARSLSTAYIMHEEILNIQLPFSQYWGLSTWHIDT